MLAPTVSSGPTKFWTAHSAKERDEWLARLRGRRHKTESATTIYALADGGALRVVPLGRDTFRMELFGDLAACGCE